MKEKEKKKSKRKTDRSTNREVDKSKQKQSMEEMQQKKNRERESYTKWESLRHRNQRPEAVPSLGVAETHYLLLLFTLCFHAVFFRHGL